MELTPAWRLWPQAGLRGWGCLLPTLLALCLNLSCQRAMTIRGMQDQEFLGFEKAQEMPFGGWVKALVFTKGGQHLVIGGCQSKVDNGRMSCVSGLINEWNVNEAVSRQTVEFPRSVTALAVSQDGTKWVAGDAEGRLIQSTATRSVPKASFHQKGEITSLAFSSDGKWIVSGSSDPSYPLGFLDVATGGMVKVKAKFAPVSALTFAPDGKELAVGMLNGSLVLWEFNAGATPFSIVSSIGEAYAIESLAFSLDGYRLAYGRRDGMVVVWDRKSDQSLVEFKGASSVTTLVFSPDGRYLTIGQENGKLLVVDSETGREVWSTRYHVAVQDLAFSPDGMSLAVAVQQRVYLNKVKGKALNAVYGQQAKHVPGLQALRVSKSMSVGKRKPSANRLAEVMSLCQDEYVWLLPFDRLAVPIIEAMVQAVPGVTVKRHGMDAIDQLVLSEKGRSLSLSLAPLLQAGEKVGLERTLRLYESAQQFILAAHPGSESVLETAAIAAFLQEVGPGVRRLSEQELKWQALESNWQDNAPIGAAQMAGRTGPLLSALDQRVQYLRLDRLTQASAQRVQKWLHEAGTQTGTVVHLLDLRDNPGGDLPSLLETASTFVPKEQLIARVIARKSGEGTEYRSKGSPLSGFNVVVLVNERTAGTAELLACSIRESGGVIIGRRTAGVDEMFTIFPLSDGSGLRISTERFYCPNNHSIRWQGQDVDIEVAYEVSQNAVKVGSTRRGAEYHVRQLGSSLPLVSDNQLRVGIEFARCLAQMPERRSASVEAGKWGQGRDFKTECLRNHVN